MRVISGDRVHELLDFKALVGALREAHCGPLPLVERAEQHHDPGTGHPQSFLNLPAWIPGRAMGIKSITVIPGNERERGLPTVHAVYLVFDGTSGQPLASIDGTVLTYYKTAADSALGCELLARQDAKTLLMCGAGAMAKPLIDAHRSVRPSIERVLIWNRTAGKAAALAEQLGGVEALAVGELEPAAREADLISCAMSSTEPYIDGAWLKPGCHLDLVGSFTPEMRESNDTAVQRASVFVDSRWFAIHEPGDIADPLSRGIIAETDILADLFELCTGAHTGRRTSDEITLFKNGGGAHLDLFTALHLIESDDATV